jgi:DNA polymerase V
MYALVDCNNFYASCERIFNPKMEGRPVVVLSNNDGCVIARSEEAKLLGIEMGAPAFLNEEKFSKNNVAIFSSNYALYGDLSDRVMKTLAGFVPRLEVYSIDEAFLDMHNMQHYDLEDLGCKIRTTVKKNIGIPVSIGIAPTKTLAKMANRYAKKNKVKCGVHWLKNKEAISTVLQCTAIGDVWGVGPQYAKMLQRNGFKTAYDLSKAPDDFVRSKMTVVGHRLLNELRGIPSIDWTFEPEDKKNICCARGFGKLHTTKKDVAEALANYTANVAEKMRKQKSCAKRLHVFVQTNAHRPDDPQYFRSITLSLPVATNNTGMLLKHAMYALDMIFRPGYNYQKCGAIVLDLIPETQLQFSMFDKAENGKSKKAFSVLDTINKGIGKDIVRVARQGFERKFKLRQAFLSPRYTTRIDELLTIKI